MNIKKRTNTTGASKESPVNPLKKNPFVKNNNNKYDVIYTDILFYLKEFHLLKTKKELDYLLKEILNIHHSYKKKDS